MLVKKYASDLGIEAYDLKENIGELRYVTVRRTRSNEQLVALLTSADADESKLNLLAEKLLAAGVDSVYWNINSSRTDDVIGATKKYWGKQYITEEMLNRKFILGPITFFKQITLWHLQLIQLFGILSKNASLAKFMICIQELARCRLCLLI